MLRIVCLKMSIFGVKRASDESFCTSTLPWRSRVCCIVHTGSEFTWAPSTVIVVGRLIFPMRVSRAHVRALKKSHWEGRMTKKRSAIKYLYRARRALNKSMISWFVKAFSNRSSASGNPGMGQFLFLAWEWLARACLWKKNNLTWRTKQAPLLLA